MAIQTEDLILGLDVGGTKIALVLGTRSGRILRREQFASPAHEPYAAARAIFIGRAQQFLARCQAEDGLAAGVVSVAVGGPLNIQKGILMSPPHLAAWGTAPIKEDLEQGLGLPVYVEHDGNAGALAEFYFGAGRGCRNLVFLTVGTGLGAGLIFNGQIYHGANDLAGEVGHWRIAPDGPIEYGKAGSWEGYCSGAGLAQLARRVCPERWPAPVTTAEIVQSALNGDEAARLAVTEMGRWLGKGLALLMDAFNPQRIVVGTLGWVLGDLLLEPARQAAAEEALPGTFAACQVVPAELREKLGDVSSLIAAINRE